MRKNSIVVGGFAGIAVLAVCLTAAPVLAQAGGSMGMPNMNNNQSMGPEHGIGQQQPGNIPGQIGSMRSMMEQVFLHSIGENVQAENALSQMALKNSSNDDVKKLAQQVVRDHQRLTSDISAAASSRSLSLPDAPPGRVRKSMKKMGTLTGSGFDQAYLRELNHYVTDDRDLVMKNENMLGSPDMRQLAMEMLNMEQDHSKQIAAAAKEENLTLK